MDNRTVFNEVVTLYDQMRPTYALALFDEIIKISELKATDKLLEIGCGTGQATEPFLKHGCHLTAIELGTDLANYTRNKYSQYNNLKVLNTTFEAYTAESTFDLIYSATAFHWIPSEIAYRGVYNLLKSGGHLALFWNIPSIHRDNPSLYSEIQAVYAKLVPTLHNKKPQENNKYDFCIEEINQAGFESVKTFEYESVRVLTSTDYILLLDTYSDHRQLDRKIRNALYNAIGSIIQKYGDRIVINDYMKLYIAMKA